MEPVQTGQKAGLWTLLDNKRKENCEANTTNLPPLIKIWCAVHRSNLAWQSVSDSVAEVGHVFQQLIGICSFFHKSGLRTRELRVVACQNHIKVLRLPKVFEVRWTEFTYNLLHAVLSSWHALMLYFQNSQEKPAGGFMAFLGRIDNLELISFLADTLVVFSRYQKQMQCDSTTILDVETLTARVKAKLTSLKFAPLLGGWVSQLTEQMQQTEPDGQVTLNGFTLHSVTRRRREHHQSVSDIREIAAVKIEVIDSLVEFLTQRFSVDDELLSIVKPFANLMTYADLKSVHAILGTDFNLQTLGLEYDEIMQMDDLEALRKLTLQDKVCQLAQSKHYMAVTTILARLVAAKPHSADVERLISCSNILKTSDRSSMHLETENLFLFIHYNMPPLVEWDPRPAVMTWLDKRNHRVTARPKGKEGAELF